MQASWYAALPLADTIALSFYCRLFEQVPATRALFVNVDLREQRRKLVSALTIVVGGLDDFETLRPALVELGQRHASFGVEDSHYDAVGAALLWALEAAPGQLWTDDLKLSWSNAYGSIASIMRQAACHFDPKAIADLSPTSHRQINKKEA